jgi:Type II secretory pathway, component PulD
VKHTLPKILLLHLLCVPLLLHAEEMILEVIPLKSRMSSDVVEILRPLVAPGGTVTGMNNQLIIKTTPDNLAELMRVLESLDKPPRRLLISVRQDSAGISYGQEQALSGKYSQGDVTTEIKDPSRTHEGLVVSAQDEKGNVVRYRQQDKSATSNDQNSFRVQSTEGYPAFINAGQSIPVPNRTTYVTPNGVVVNDATEYMDATTGFYVLPRLNGDQVTLLVAPSLSKASPGKAPVFDVQNVETTATGRLGEWIAIGGINQDMNSSNRRILSSSSSQRQLSNTILIKVDEVK